jgi:hypothetical protein
VEEQDASRVGALPDPIRRQSTGADRQGSDAETNLVLRVGGVQLQLPERVHARDGRELSEDRVQRVERAVTIGSGGEDGAQRLPEPANPDQRRAARLLPSGTGCRAYGGEPASEVVGRPEELDGDAVDDRHRVAQVDPRVVPHPQELHHPMIGRCNCLYLDRRLTVDATCPNLQTYDRWLPKE